MAAQPIPQQEQGQSQGQGQGDQGKGGDPMAEWRQFAEVGQQLAKKYPEATDEMVSILKGIQKIMTKVAGNPQRTQPQPAPPSA